MEEQIDSDERGGGREYLGEIRGRGNSRNMSRRLMGMENRVGIDCGGWAGQGEQRENGTTVTEQQ